MSHFCAFALISGLAVALLLTASGCMDRSGYQKIPKPEESNIEPALPPTQDQSIENPECLSDIMTPPADEHCECVYPPGACDASEMRCTCDLACYGDADCPINCTCDDPMCTTVTCMAREGLAGDCQSLECTQPNDIDPDFSCVATDCVIEPNVVVLDPSEPPQVDVLQQDLVREVREAGSITLLDPSGSMKTNQQHLACTVDSFLDTVEAAGAEFSMGVGVMNPQKLYDRSCDMISDAVPDLVGVSGCSVVPQCSTTGCGSGSSVNCERHFTNNGAPVTSSDVGAADTLRQLFVQGENRSENDWGEGCGDDETCFEYAMRYIMYLVSVGREDEISQVNCVSDEGADGDGAACKIQKRRHDPKNMDIMRAALGADFNPPKNTGKCTEDLVNFYSYFFNRYGVQANALVMLSKPDPVYVQVVKATGGVTGDVEDCDKYDEFWAAIGTTTAEISTSMCVGAMDPTTATLHYIENGVNQVVPYPDGWTHNDATGCIVLHGTYKDLWGQFRITYNSQDAPTPSGPRQICFENGEEPVIGTLVVTAADGQVLSESSSDGWTFDAQTDCFTLHGPAAELDGPFSVAFNGN